jgi:hypothetical protein
MARSWLDYVVTVTILVLAGRVKHLPRPSSSGTLRRPFHQVARSRTP